MGAHLIKVWTARMQDELASVLARRLFSPVDGWMTREAVGMGWKMGRLRGLCTTGKRSRRGFRWASEDGGCDECTVASLEYAEDNGWLLGLGELSSFCRHGGWVVLWAALPT